MKRISWILLFISLGILAGCATKAVQAPVPGSINTFDAYAFRSLADAQAALLSVKTWETCSDSSFPPTVTFDGQTVACDSTAGTFPVAGRPLLFKAEQTYNATQAAGHAYHSGATQDASGLTSALTQLGIDISSLLSGVGKGN